MSSIVPPAGVLVQPAVARRVCRSWAGVAIQRRWSASLRFTDVSPRSPVLGAEARALGEDGGRRGGVRARPAETTLLEKGKHGLESRRMQDSVKKVWKRLRTQTHLHWDMELIPVLVRRDGTGSVLEGAREEGGVAGWC